MLVLTRCSSDGRAGGLGPSGRRFDPCHLDNVFVAQLVSEHSAFNGGVTGSNPVGDTISTLSSDGSSGCFTYNRSQVRSL